MQMAATTDESFRPVYIMLSGIFCLLRETLVKFTLKLLKLEAQLCLQQVCLFLRRCFYKFHLRRA